MMGVWWMLEHQVRGILVNNTSGVSLTSPTCLAVSANPELQYFSHFYNPSYPHKSRWMIQTIPAVQSTMSVDYKIIDFLYSIKEYIVSKVSNWLRMVAVVILILLPLCFIKQHCAAPFRNYSVWFESVQRLFTFIWNYGKRPARTACQPNPNSARGRVLLPHGPHHHHGSTLNILLKRVFW